MADSKWIVTFSFLLGVLCNCQEGPLVNLEETGVISCSSNTVNFVAVPADIVEIQAGEPDKEICLDPSYVPSTFPFYHTVSCERDGQSPRLSRQLLMSRDDIQHFRDLGGRFCLEDHRSNDSNDKLLLGMNLAGISREDLDFSLKLVCRAVGTSGAGGADVETSALIEPRNTTSLRFIPQGQNGNVTTEKGVPVKIAVLVALPDELKNVNTSWSDSRITCGPDADVEVPECVYTSQVGIQVTWSCSITTNKSDEYTFQHRGTSYVVRLTVHDSNSTDPSPSPPPPQGLTAIIVVPVLIGILIVIGLVIGVIIGVVCCYRRLSRPIKDVRDTVMDTNQQLARQRVENGRVDTLSELSHEGTPLESPNQPSDALELTGSESTKSPEKCDVSSDMNSNRNPDVNSNGNPDVNSNGNPDVNSNGNPDVNSDGNPDVKNSNRNPDVNSDAIPDDHRCSITDSNIEAAMRNNSHTHTTDDRGSTELHIRSQSEDKPRPSGADLHNGLNGHIPTLTA